LGIVLGRLNGQNEQNEDRDHEQTHDLRHQVASIIQALTRSDRRPKLSHPRHGYQRISDASKTPISAEMTNFSAA